MSTEQIAASPTPARRSLALAPCFAAVADHHHGAVAGRHGGGPATATVRTTRATSRRRRSPGATSRSCRWPGPIRSAMPAAVPIVVRGVIYGRGRNGSLVALDAATGKELWVRESMNGMTSRGMNYWESADGRDQRLIFAMDRLLQEIDAKTGKSIMSFGTNGVVDLRVGLDGRDPASIGNIQSSIPGEVFENLVIVGSATGEGYMSPPGDIRAYDVTSGKLAWTFHTVPRPGEFGYDTWPKDAWKYIGGVNNWGEMTVDTRARHRLHPARLADLRLLRRRSHRQQSVRNVNRRARRAHREAPVAFPVRASRPVGSRSERRAATDDDPPQRPQPRRGRRRRARRRGCTCSIASPASRSGRSKSDRSRSRTCPASRAGRRSPIRPTRRRMRGSRSERRTSVRISPADEAARFRTRLLAAKNLGLFTPINYSDTVHIPTSNGGVLFGGMASEPSTGAVYVVSHDNPGILRLVRPGETSGRGAPPPPPGQVAYQQNCQSCHGADRLGSDSVPALVYATADPANNIAAGAPRFDASTIRTVVAAGKGRMPPFRASDPGGRRCAGDAVDDDARSARPGSRRARTRCRAGGIGRAAGTDRRIRVCVDPPGTARRTWAWCVTALSRRRAAVRASGDQRIQHGRQPDRAAIHVDREVRPQCASHQVACRLRRRSGTGSTRNYRHRGTRAGQRRDRHRVRPAVWRRA